ncbi:hypothetical protein STEG23_032012 [Scotinomys teguina]
MCGAFGKPQGTVARVHVGQVILSICTKLQNKEHVIEILVRAKFKFPGCQKIHISKKGGFTKFNADEFEDIVSERQLTPDGCGIKYIPNCGPLDKGDDIQIFGSCIASTVDHSSYRKTQGNLEFRSGGPTTSSLRYLECLEQHSTS